MSWKGPANMAMMACFSGLFFVILIGLSFE
jgi:hypothetical protein